MDAKPDHLRPLADRMRPRVLTEVVGQTHLLGPGKPLRRLAEGAALHSALFWGPPGTGKTTLARLVAKAADAEFAQLSKLVAANGDQFCLSGVMCGVFGHGGKWLTSGNGF